MSFSVAFNTRDILDTIQGVKSAAQDRDFQLQTLGKKAKKSKNVQKLVAINAISQIDPAYQQNQIEKIADQGTFQKGVKEYMKDRTKGLDDATANRLRMAQLVRGLGRYGDYPLEGEEDIYRGPMDINRGPTDMSPEEFERIQRANREAEEIGVGYFQEIGPDELDVRVNPQLLRDIMAIKAYEEQDDLREEIRGASIREITGPSGTGELDIQRAQENRRQIMELAKRTGVNPLDDENISLAQMEDYVRGQIRMRDPRFKAQLDVQQTFLNSPLSQLDSPSAPVVRSIYGGASVTMGGNEDWERERVAAMKRGDVQNPLYGTAHFSGRQFYIPKDLADNYRAEAAKLGITASIDMPGIVSGPGSLRDVDSGGGAVRGRRGRPVDPIGFEKLAEKGVGRKKELYGLLETAQEAGIPELLGGLFEEATRPPRREMERPDFPFSLFD